MTRDAQLAALERLMDDPSPVVRKAVLKGVQAAGTEGLLWLQQLSKNQTLGPYALALLTELRTPESCAQALIHYLQAGDIDLEEACLLLERIQNPKLADGAYKEKLDQLCARTRELIAEPLDVRAKCRLLCRVLYGEEGYRGSQQSFATPESSLLSHVARVLAPFARPRRATRYPDFALPHLSPRRPAPRTAGRAGRLAWSLHGRGLPRQGTALH